MECTIYIGYTTTDEKGSLGGKVCYSLSESTAKELVEGKGYFESAGTVREFPALKVGDNYFLLAQKEPISKNDIDKTNEKRKKKALDKLSDEDKKMLGLI